MGKDLQICPTPTTPSTAGDDFHSRFAVNSEWRRWASTGENTHPQKLFVVDISENEAYGGRCIASASHLKDIALRRIAPVPTVVTFRRRAQAQSGALARQAESEVGAMGKRIYVGNLPWSIDDAALEELFAPYGKVVSAEVLVDRTTGRSRGFGFVEMDSDQATSAAVAGLNMKNIGGRQLTVNEAQPRKN